MNRTADDIFDTVLGLCFWEESDKADYETQFIHVLNVILAECFDANNSLRRMRGAEELETIPEITALTDEVGYEDKFERIVIPYGVASIIYVEDDEQGMANIYRSYYAEKREENSVAYFTDAEEWEEA